MWHRCSRSASSLDHLFPTYQSYLLTPHPAYPQGGRQQEAIGLGPMNSGSQREALNRMPSQTPLPLEPPTPPAKPPPTPPYANERSRGGSLEGLLGGPSDGVSSYLLGSLSCFEKLGKPYKKQPLSFVAEQKERISRYHTEEWYV